MPGHRTVRYQLERTVARLRIGENQAGRGPSGSTSVSAGNGASGILQEERRRLFGFRAIGARNEAGAAGRSSHFGNCGTSWKDAGAGAAGLGGAAWYGSANNTQDRGPRAGEFRHLRAYGRRAGRNQSNSD